MNQKPIIYSCSGCSLAGQYAYKLALYMDKKGIAEMSCIVGLAAGIPSFTKKIINRQIWIIDGCPIQCSKTLLTNRHILETKHIKLYELGIKKNTEPEQPVNFDNLIESITRNS